MQLEFTIMWVLETENQAEEAEAKALRAEEHLLIARVQRRLSTELDMAGKTSRGMGSVAEWKTKQAMKKKQCTTKKL